MSLVSVFVILINFKTISIIYHEKNNTTLLKQGIDFIENKYF